MGIDAWGRRTSAAEVPWPRLVPQHREPVPGRLPRVDRPPPQCVGWEASRAFRTWAAKPASSSTQTHTGRTCRPGMGAPTSRRHPTRRARQHEPIRTKPRWRARSAPIQGTHTTPSARGTARRRSPVAPRAEVAYVGSQDESATSARHARRVRPPPSPETRSTGLRRHPTWMVGGADASWRSRTLRCSSRCGGRPGRVCRAGADAVAIGACRGSTGVVSAAPGSFRAWAFESRSFPARVHADERSSGDGAPT